MKTCENCKYWISRTSTEHIGECIQLDTDDNMMLYVLVTGDVEEPEDEEVIIVTNRKFGCSEWEASDRHKREVEEEKRERMHEETLEQRQNIHDYLIAKGRI